MLGRNAATICVSETARLCRCLQDCAGGFNPKPLPVAGFGRLEMWSRPLTRRGTEPWSGYLGLAQSSFPAVCCAAALGRKGHISGETITDSRGFSTARLPRLVVVKRHATARACYPSSLFCQPRLKRARCLLPAFRALLQRLEENTTVAGPDFAFPCATGSSDAHNKAGHIAEADLCTGDGREQLFLCNRMVRPPLVQAV